MADLLDNAGRAIGEEATHARLECCLEADMARKVIAGDELLRMINDRMASLEECRNLSFTGIRFDPERTHGGNWATAGWHRSGADHDQVGCSEAIAKFLAELQETYDISGE